MPSVTMADAILSCAIALIGILLGIITLIPSIFVLLREVLRRSLKSVKPSVPDHPGYKTIALIEQAYKSFKEALPQIKMAVVMLVVCSFSSIAWLLAVSHGILFCTWVAFFLEGISLSSFILGFAFIIRAFWIIYTQIISGVTEVEG